MRIAALPTDRLPSDGIAVSAFAKTGRCQWVVAMSSLNTSVGVR